MKIPTDWLIRQKHVLLNQMFQRGLAIIYFAAFASISSQIEGLIGEHGIMPIHTALAAIAAYFPESKYYAFPTLFWANDSDRALQLACGLGMLCSTALFFGILRRLSLICNYGLYLSISLAGQSFTSFQWDAFLLETGFLAIILTWGSTIAVYCFRWLLARFMFMGGVVKITSGDPTWQNFTALNYHYHTQPLPTPLAYYADFLPHWFNSGCVGAVLAIELILPFFVFLPRPFRLVAATGFTVLQIAILLTGNYNFFNLLTILLCLFLLDDRDIARIVPPILFTTGEKEPPVPGIAANSFAAAWFCLVLMVNASYVLHFRNGWPLPQPVRYLLQFTSTFSLVNNYGPFAVMTTQRPEIIVQGSNDGTEWRDYRFKYKPVALDQPLRWNIPHQPRLDWQMWFAALQPPSKVPWFPGFIARLREGSPQVLALLADNPFPEKPPRYVRALLYRYWFATPEQRATTGDIWQREYLGVYWPAFVPSENDAFE